MTKENGVKQLTDMVADFVGHIGKKLPDDVVKKLEEPGYRCSSVLAEMRNQLPVHQRAGRTSERGCCTGYFRNSVKTQLCRNF